MARILEKMASLADLSGDDFADFLARLPGLAAGEVGAILGYLLGRLQSGDAAAMVRAVRATHPQRDFRRVGGRATVNMVGTGGGPSTFNITTTASFVVAAAGGVVVKTGSNACRSRSGFAEVAAKLGTLKLAMPWELIESIAAEVGIVFVPLSQYAPVLGHFERILTPSVYRGAASYLNKIGPLLSPVRVGHQFIGANSPACLEMVAAACRQLGDTPATVVCSADGMDEVSIGACTSLIDLDAARERRTGLIDPAAFGIEPPAPGELSGHEPAAAAECCQRILGGQGTRAQTQIVALNAAAVLTSLGLFDDLRAAFQEATQILASGAALDKLNQLRQRVWKCVKR